MKKLEESKQELKDKQKIFEDVVRDAKDLMNKSYERNMGAKVMYSCLMMI